MTVIVCSEIDCKYWRDKDCEKLIIHVSDCCEDYEPKEDEEDDRT